MVGQVVMVVNFENVWVLLVVEVVQNYVDVCSYQCWLVIVCDNLVSQFEILQIIEWWNQVGLVSSSDVEQVWINCEQIWVGIFDFEVGLSVVENWLVVLFGCQFGVLYVELFDLWFLLMVKVVIGVGILVDVLCQWLDLIVVECILVVEMVWVGQKLVVCFFSLVLSGFFGWQVYSFVVFGGSDMLFCMFGGSLVVMLFDGGKLCSVVDIQSVVQEEVLIFYEVSVLVVLEEVENVLVVYVVFCEWVDVWCQVVEFVCNVV